MLNSQLFLTFVFGLLLITNMEGWAPDQNDKKIARDQSEKRVVLNPYKRIDWPSFGHHKAALHIHTLQSDGYYIAKEVVEAYRAADYSIIAITDHDWNRPNARINWGQVSEEHASPYPLDPKPDNYPANVTWPWQDFGIQSPKELGVLGIEAAELTFRHHINSYFSDYGVWYERTGSEAPYGGIVDEDGNELWEDDFLNNAKEHGGVAILNHPGLSHDRGFWQRKPVEWYIERYQNHSAEYLIGMEVTNTDNYADLVERERYDEALWDQLLGNFMPQRPIWGFGTDDMHNLENVPDMHTVFIIAELTDKAVREAMVNGQFYFTKSTRRVNYLEDDMSVFPTINRIDVDHDAGTITINADDYDKIKWISTPESSGTVEDYKTSDQPWAAGRMVHEGEKLNLNNTSNIGNYVRAELIRMEGDEIYRSFTNPFGIGSYD
ncbi:MAG: hypothetical protein WD038_01255 [Balneolales bacterium]